MIAFPMNYSVEEVKPQGASTRPKVLGWMAFAAVGLTLMVVGVMNGAGVAAFRRESGILKRMLAAPMTRTDIVWVAAASTAIEVAAASAVILAGSVVLTGAEVAFNPLNAAHWLAVAMLIVAVIASLGLGLLLSPLPRSAKAASGLSLAVALPLIFLTGIWFPKFMLPAPLRLLADYFPVTVALDISRDSLVWGEIASTSRVAYATASSMALFLAGSAVAVKKALREA